MLASRVLHSRLRLHDSKRSRCLATMFLLHHICMLRKGLGMQKDLISCRSGLQLVLMLVLMLLLG